MKKIILGAFSFFLVAAAVLNLNVRTVSANSCQTPQVISFPFAVQADTLGVGIAANTTVNGDVYSNAHVQGQLFSKVNGDVSAVGQIANLTVSGSKTAPSPPLALPALNTLEWETAASLGGTVSGDVVFGVNSRNNSLGPLKIDGNLTLSENSQVSITGNVFVSGNITVLAIGAANAVAAISGLLLVRRLNGGKRWA